MKLIKKIKEFFSKIFSKKTEEEKIEKRIEKLEKKQAKHETVKRMLEIEDLKANGLNKESFVSKFARTIKETAKENHKTFKSMLNDATVKLTIAVLAATVLVSCLMVIAAECMTAFSLVVTGGVAFIAALVFVIISLHKAWN